MTKDMEEVGYINEADEAEMMDYYDSIDAASLFERIGVQDALFMISRQCDNVEVAQTLHELWRISESQTFGKGVDV